MRVFSKNLGLMWKIAVLLVICCCGLSLQAKYGGGTGEPNHPYLIYTAEQMNAIGADSNDWDKHFKLMADIDLSVYTGISFNMIGYWLNWGDNKPFSGVFDGNGYRILNFSYISPSSSYIGVFGYVRGDNAEIKDLGLIDPNIDATSGDYVGSLIGILGVGSVSNCSVEGGSISGGVVVGGLVGLNYAKITTTYSITSVFGNKQVGGLVGQNCGTITNCYSKPEVSGYEHVGGLVGYNRYGTIINCQSNGDVSGIFNIGGLAGRNSKGAIANCDSSGDVSGQSRVGGLVGSSSRNIIKCCSTNSVAGNDQVGGLVGVKDYGTITNCYSTGSVTGNTSVGGLVGVNLGAISNCYSTGSFVGSTLVGGLVGDNRNLIRNCYSSGIVSGSSRVGGLIGIHRMKEVINCYSKGGVTGNDDVGGLVGYYNDGSYTKCFWNNTVNSGLSGIGNTTDPNVIGESTTNMQIEKTFTDAGWDFNTPVWTIDEGKYYPRLWWEMVPVMYTEPEITLGTINIIFWGPLFGDFEYYVECAEDANFTSIIYNSGWITETSFEFADLELGKRYWYSVKARNAEDVESQWSNVEFSLQGTLIDAVDIMLDPNSMKNENMKKTLLNKIDEALEMIDGGDYTGALNKLENDILAKMNGCDEMGGPDNNDWIITCEQQNVVYPLVVETIEYVKSLME